MELTLVTPLRKQTYAIVWLEINTPAGNFVIQPGHVPTVLTLSPQEKITFCLTNGKHESIMIKQGIAHITRDSATMLINENE